MVLYLFVMITIARRALRKICHSRPDSGEKKQILTSDQIGAVIVIVLASAATTELLEIHAIFGAFVAGAVMPRNKSVSAAIHMCFDDILSILLLPLFFAYAGLRTNLAALTSAQDWIICSTIVAVAVTSKIGACLVAGRATGMPLRTASGLGVLMNARGLMELVLLTIGLQLGIITPALFTIMVLMAIFTTIITPPLFHIFTLGSAKRSATLPSTSQPVRAYPVSAPVA
jgi:Kef-type K+ transport system membrane component KefB